MRLSLRGIQNIRRGLKRSWENGTHRTKQQTREIDADTLRDRARYDRRGSLILSGNVPTELGPKRVIVRWSVLGRVDQMDIVIDTVVVKTCRPALVIGFLVGIYSTSVKLID